MSEKSVIKAYNTPEEYIINQSVERQDALNHLRAVIKANLPNGFEETIQYNMVGYVVPHSIYPKGYHVNPKEPLPFLAFANQKGFIALYHIGIYADKNLQEWFEKSYSLLGIGKLDMGKSCIRFKNISKIPYELIGELCTKISVDEYIEIYEKIRLIDNVTQGRQTV